MKATDVIRRDHRAIEDLFAEFKNAPSEEGMERLLLDALNAHEMMEDTFFYPAIRDEMAEHDTALAELEQEQMKLKAEVLVARALPGDRDSRIESLMSTVLAHAAKEERELLPEAEKVLGAEMLEALGQDMESESAVAKLEL